MMQKADGQRKTMNRAEMQCRPRCLTLQVHFVSEEARRSLVVGDKEQEKCRFGAYQAAATCRGHVASQGPATASSRQ